MASTRYNTRRAQCEVCEWIVEADSWRGAIGRVYEHLSWEHPGIILDLKVVKREDQIRGAKRRPAGTSR